MKRRRYQNPLCAHRFGNGRDRFHIAGANALANENPMHGTARLRMRRIDEHVDTRHMSVREAVRGDGSAASSAEVNRFVTSRICSTCRSKYALASTPRLL